MKIAIIGAGGIGGYTGGRLAASGADVSFLARGRNLEALRRTGLGIASPRGDVHIPRVHAASDPAEIGPADIVLVTTKLWDLDSVGATLAPLVVPRTIVVTLQNGIDARDILSRHVPAAQISSGVYFISSHLEAPGRVRDTGGENRMVIDSLGDDPRLAAFAAACSRATGLACIAADPRVDDFVWQKFIVLTAFSGVTALFSRSIGDVRDNPVSRRFLDDLIDEATAVAHAAGRPIAPDSGEQMRRLMLGWPAEAMASMAVDLLHGRRLELPWLSGRVHQLGQQLNVPTPAHSRVWEALLPYAMGNPALEEQPRAAA